MGEEGGSRGGKGRRGLQLPPHHLPPPHSLYRDPILNTSIYDNHNLIEPRMGESFTTSSGDTTTTKSTIRTVNFRDPMVGTLSGPEVGSSMQMTNSIQVEQMLTDEVVVTHPRALLILAWIQLAIAVQLLVFGMICTFYGGCPYSTALWTSVLFILSAIFGMIFLKFRPQRYMLYFYTAFSIITTLLSLLLFIVTARLLDTEDRLLRQKGWDHEEGHIFELNRIVENTKIAMYSLHLIMTPFHGLCAGASGVLLLCNVRESREGRVRKGYYVSSNSLGHQTVLVPIELKQVKQIPTRDLKKSVGSQTAYV